MVWGSLTDVCLMSELQQRSIAFKRFKSYTVIQAEYVGSPEMEMQIFYPRNVVQLRGFAIHTLCKTKKQTNMIFQARLQKQDTD